MKVSEIRAKFPMYSDLSDDELIIGIHKKFYSDIPLGKFTQNIEYDKADPTEGMSGLDKFRAGMGKAFYDVARGAGQVVGLVDREDVAESRKRDAPLMRSGAGVAGNIAGNVGALLPTAFIPGAATIPGAAAIGAASGFLQPSTSTSETLMNTGIGGIAAPAAILAGRGISATYQGAKGLVEPMTRQGQERIAARVLQASATNPERAAANALNARPLVSGSQPTLAQVADDPGLAQLERTILNNPEAAPALQQRFAAQRAARMGAVADVAGTDDYYNAIKEGRRIFANEDYSKAIQQGIDPDMAKAVGPQLQSLLERPSIQRAQRDAVRLAKENGVSLAESPAGSLEGLDWVKKALDNQISKAAVPGSSIGKEELRALLQTKDDLMKTMELLAPGYKEANDAYAAMSRQVNSMDVARSLMDKLQKPGSEYAGASAKEMGDAYMRALSQAQDSVKKATGMNKNISQVMNTRDIAQLEGVARDLGRKSFAENAGRATGSNTAQNLASQNMLRRILGPTGLPETWAESTMLQSMLYPVQGVSKLTGADRRIQERIAMSLLDPSDAAGLLMVQPPVSRGLLDSRVQRLLPATTGGLLGVQLQQ
jgi:hypothetical protein